MTNPQRRAPGSQRFLGRNHAAPASAYQELLAQETSEAADAAPGAIIGVLSPAAMAVQQAPLAYDMERELFQETFAPFAQAPPSNPVAGVAHYANAIMGVIGLVDQIQYVGIAARTAPLAAVIPPLPVQTLGSMTMGIPHTHVHPPSTTPPAPPCPLPSLGAIALPGSLAVLVGSRPMARAGDVGLIASCVSFGVPCEIMLGSSNTLVGGSRAARVGPDLFFHDNPGEMGGVAAFLLGASNAAAALGAAGQAAEGNFMAAGLSVAQMAADAAALALKMLRKVDPGAPPDMGATIEGDATVLVGGIPLPAAKSLADIIGAIRKGLAARAARRAPTHSEEGAHGRVGSGEEEGTAGCHSCPR